MSFPLAKEPEKKERELIKSGMHPAYMYRLVYLGTQFSERFNTQSQKIWIDFELPNQVVEYEDKDTKEKKSFVRTLGMEFTYSLAEKSKLRPFIQGWLGRSLTADELQGFDPTSLLGEKVVVSVSHNTNKNTGKTREEIVSASQPMEGMAFPEMVNQPVEIGKDEWGGEEFNKLPKFLQEKIQESNEWKLMNKGTIDELPTINLEEGTQKVSVVIDGVPF